MRHSALQPAVIKCHIQIIYIYMSSQSCYPYIPLRTSRQTILAFLLPITPSVSSSHHSACHREKHEWWRAHYNSEVVPLSDEGITDVDTYLDSLRTLHSPQPSSLRSKNEFCTKHSPLELHHLKSHLLKVCCLGQSVPLSPSCIPGTTVVHKLDRWNRNCDRRTIVECVGGKSRPHCWQ